MPDSQGLKPYQTIVAAGESEIVIQKSRFLGYCVPISNEAEAQEALNALRKQHYDARHCCYAFRLHDGGVTRSSDDGEPSGTAGAPILSVLSGAGAENVLCAVVRYFGGVLLGTGGLVRAYGSAASEALKHAEIAQVRVCERLRLTVSYSAYQLVEPMLHQKRYPCESAFFENVKLTILLPVEESEALIAAVTDKTDGSAQIDRLGKSLEAYKPSGTSASS